MVGSSFFVESCTINALFSCVVFASLYVGITLVLFDELILNVDAVAKLVLAGNIDSGFVAAKKLEVGVVGVVGTISLA